MSSIDYIRDLNCDVVHRVYVVRYDVRGVHMKAQWTKNHPSDIDGEFTDRDMDLSYTTED